VGALVGDRDCLLPVRGLDVIEDCPVGLLDLLLVRLADILERIAGDVDRASLVEALGKDLLKGADRGGTPSVMPSKSDLSPRSRRSLKWACQLAELSAAPARPLTTAGLRSGGSSPILSVGRGDRHLP